MDNNINGYRLIADSYRFILDKERAEGNSTEEIENNIRVYDVLASFMKDDRFIAFDSGMFNDILRGYIELLLDEQVNDKDLRMRLSDGAYGIMERYSANDAERRYYNG